MRKTNNNPRRDFLKRISIAIVSISSISVFNFNKSNNYSEITINTLSKSEADEIIKSEKFPASAQLNPAPAPVEQKTTNG